MVEKIIGSDVVGAVCCEFSGATLGPGGAVAFGLCSGAFTSCATAMWEATKCDDGWVGKAARWISSWF